MKRKKVMRTRKRLTSKRIFVGSLFFFAVIHPHRTHQSLVRSEPNHHHHYSICFHSSTTLVLYPWSSNLVAIALIASPSGPSIAPYCWASNLVYLWCNFQTRIITPLIDFLGGLYSAMFLGHVTHVAVLPDSVLP